MRSTIANPPCSSSVGVVCLPFWMGAMPLANRISTEAGDALTTPPLINSPPRASPLGIGCALPTPFDAIGLTLLYGMSQATASMIFVVERPHPIGILKTALTLALPIFLTHSFNVSNPEALLWR